MLYCYSTENFKGILEGFFKDAVEQGFIAPNQVQVLSYDQIHFFKVLPSGAYLFADLERLLPLELAMVKRLARRLRSRPESYTIVTDPNHWLNRIDLLRALAKAGINDFNAYYLHEINKSNVHLRFPVFIRMENDHHGTRSDLLYSHKEIKQAIKKLPFREWLTRHQALVVEYCDTSNDKGWFEKYSAYNINGKLIPCHVLFSKRWMLKQHDLINEKTAHAEEVFVKNFPHAKVIEEVFRLSGTGYGRIDYSVKSGRVQVWEINTNPNVARHISKIHPLRQPLQGRIRNESMQTFADLARHIPGDLGQVRFSWFEALVWFSVQQLGRFYSRWRR